MQDIDLKIMYGNQNRNISQIFTVQKMDCLRTIPFKWISSNYAIQQLLLQSRRRPHQRRRASKRPAMNRHPCFLPPQSNPSPPRPYHILRKLRGNSLRTISPLAKRGSSVLLPFQRSARRVRFRQLLRLNPELRTFRKMRKLNRRT